MCGADEPWEEDALGGHAGQSKSLRSQVGRVGLSWEPRARSPSLKVISYWFLKNTEHPLSLPPQDHQRHQRAYVREFIARGVKTEEDVTLEAESEQTVPVRLEKGRYQAINKECRAASCSTAQHPTSLGCSGLGGGEKWLQKPMLSLW